MKEFLITRRKKLLELVENDSLIILSSGNELKMSEDALYPFFTNRHFFYLTNISQEDSYLVLTKSIDNSEHLFIQEFSEKKEKWYGRKITINEAKELSFIENIHLLNSLKSTIKSLLNSNIKNIYLDFSVNEKIINEIKQEYASLNIKDIYPLITSLRMKKDESEINDIKEAIKVTHLGFKRIVKELKSATQEFEIYNAFNQEILNHGTHEIGFPSIIASGVHACCLHYPTPYDSIAKNSLILCDVGAAYHHYSSDVTRTFPVNGKFNDYQKMIYDIVLSTNKEVIKYIRPGRTLKDLQEFTKNYLASRLLEKGIIKENKELDNYYFHNISHHLGLDTHDASDRDKKLEPGMVITVEPGLYIKEKEIGVRIEDDVLVTEDGSINLSIDIPKEINDIEKLFIGG